MNFCGGLDIVTQLTGKWMGEIKFKFIIRTGHMEIG